MKQPGADVPATPEPPAGARAALALDADRFALVERYSRTLATTGVERGLIGPREAPRLWERHLFNCAALAEAIPREVELCDIGSGAGLPGLVLALVREDLRVTLLEPLLRRTTFLTETVADLGLGERVRVERSRAEDWQGRFDVVTARAVAPLDRLLEWSMPLVAPSGALLAMKGVSAAEEIAAAADTLRRLGCAEPEVLELGPVGGLDAVSTVRVVRVVHADPSRVSWPSMTGSSDRPTSGTKRRRGA